MTDTGCIDSCILGRCWQDAGGDSGMGGPKFLPPMIFGQGYGGFTDTQQCFIALGQTATFSGDSCSAPTVAPTTLAPSDAPVVPAQTVPPAIGLGADAAVLKGDFTDFPSAAPTN